MAGRRKKEKQPKVKAEKKRMRIRPPRLKTVLLWIFEIALTILFAYVFVFFFCHARTNVGQAMDVTLANDDVILMNSLVYKVSTPKRGDIVVFKPNGNANSYSYIRRVIGEPGDTIEIREGIIYINDAVYLENGEYPLISEEGAGLAAETVTVGANEIFVLGDNRNNSDDSRHADIGNVSLEDIEGKVWFRVSPRNKFGFLK